MLLAGRSWAHPMLPHIVHNHSYFFTKPRLRISISSSSSSSSIALQTSTPLPQTAGTRSIMGKRWWQKAGPPNMRDINSTHEFLNGLISAGEKLVVVDFYASWCGACKTIYPKMCQIAVENPNVEFLKVNFEENKSMCKSMKVGVLPLFHFYRGSEGRLTSFTCSLSNVQKLRDAIARHTIDHQSITLCQEFGEKNILGLASSSPTSSLSVMLGLTTIVPTTSSQAWTQRQNPIIVESSNSV